MRSGFDKELQQKLSALQKYDHGHKFDGVFENELKETYLQEEPDGREMETLAFGIVA